MTLNEWVFWLGTGVIIFDAVIAWTHITLYATKSRWTLYDEGKALMRTIVSYALVLTYVASITIQAATHGVSISMLQDYPQRGIIRGLIFAIVGYVLCDWLILLLRNQRSARKEARK